MKQEDLFKVLDALQLTVDDVIQYLKKMCEKTPLKLAFKDQKGKIYYTNKPSERKDSDVFLGIVIETAIFSPADFNVRNLKNKTGAPVSFHEGFLAEEIYSSYIFDWAKEFGCYPAQEKQLELLYKFRFEYDETQQILKYHHIEARPLEAKALCLKNSEGAYVCGNIYDLQTGSLGGSYRLIELFGNSKTQIKPYAYYSVPM